MARRIAPRRAESRRRSTASGSARTMGAAAPGDGGDLRCRDRKGAVTGPGILRMRPGLVTAPSRSRQGMRSRCRGSDGPAGARLRGRAGRAESHRRWRSGGWSRRIERGALRSTPPPPNVTQAADVPLEADVRFLRQPLLLRQTSSFSLEGASSSLGKRFTWHGERLLLAGERVLLARERVPLAWCTRPSRGWARPPRSRTRSPRMVHASFSPVGASSSLANAFTSYWCTAPPRRWARRRGSGARSPCMESGVFPQRHRVVSDVDDSCSSTRFDTAAAARLRRSPTRGSGARQPSFRRSPPPQSPPPPTPAPAAPAP